MNKIDRRSALGISLAAASAAMIRPAAAQTMGYKDATPWPGVVVRTYEGETPFCQRLKNFLEIECGSTNDLKKFAGCSLLLSSLGQLAPQLLDQLIATDGGHLGRHWVRSAF
jgi:hypothetical protein